MVHCYFLYVAQAFAFNDFNFAYAVSRVHFKTREHALCRRYGNYGCYLASPVSDVVHNVITESIVMIVSLIELRVFTRVQNSALNYHSFSCCCDG